MQEKIRRVEFRMSPHFWRLLGEDFDARRKAVERLLAGWDGEVLSHALRPEWAARHKLTVPLPESVLAKLETVQSQHKVSRAQMLASAYLQYLEQASGLLQRYFRFLGREAVSATCGKKQTQISPDCTHTPPAVASARIASPAPEASDVRQEPFAPAPEAVEDVALAAPEASDVRQEPSAPAPAPESAAVVDDEADVEAEAVACSEAAALPFQNQSPYSDEQLLELYRAVLRLRQRATVSLRVNSRIESVQTEGDEADMASAIQENRRVEWYHRKATQLLAECEAALQRMIAGEYGWCELTGEPIPLARMQANPLARYTVEAQEQIERRQKLGVMQ